MDFGGFILFFLLAFVMIAVGIYVAAQFVRRAPERRADLKWWLGGMAVLVLFGRFLYQVYWLDEGLYMAAASGNTAQVRVLLSKGASPNARWEDGTSALSTAKSHGYTEIAVLLVKAGAE